jgi:hypothetical protein
MSKGLIIGIISTVLIGGAAAVWYFFSGSEKHLKLVPADAVVVVTVDWGSLAKKALAADFKNSQWFLDMEKEATTTGLTKEQIVMRDIMNNPTDVGVNVMSGVYFFMQSRGEDTHSAFVFDVNEPNKFEATVKKFDDQLTVVLEKNYRYVNVGYDAVLAWNQDGGIFIKNMTYNERYEDIWSKPIMNEVFARPADKSITANPEFAAFKKKGGDASFFVNGSALAEVIGKQEGGMMSLSSTMPNTGEAYKNIFITGTLNFNDGNIAFDSEILGENPEFEKTMIFADKGVSEEHLKMMSNKDVLAFVSMNVDMYKLMDYLKVFIGNDIDEVLASQGLTVEKLKAMFSGELSFALNGMEYKTPIIDPEYAMFYDEEPEPEMTPIFTFNFSSNDKEGFKTLFRKSFGANAYTETPQGVFQVRMPYMIAFDVAETPVGFAISNNDALVASIAQGGMGAPFAPAAELAKDNALAAYWNMNVNSYSQDFTDYMNRQGGRDYQAFSKYVEIFSEMKMKGGLRKSHMEMNMATADINSFTLMVKQFDEVYKLAKKDREDVDF